MEIIPTAGVLPSYKDLKKSPDSFYELFSEATYKYNTICDTLQKLQHANAMLVKVLNDLMKMSRLLKKKKMVLNGMGLIYLHVWNLYLN